MKKTTFLFTLAISLWISIGITSATVFRVNNGLTENISGRLFTEIKSAHDHVSVRNGDTLMVEGSGKEYEFFTCTKRLIIMGPGYFLGENNGVNSVVASAKVSSITFEVESKGSYLIGMEVTFRVSVFANNVYIIRSKANQLYFNRAAGCKVAMSHITSIGGFAVGGDISVTNSIIDNDASGIAYVNYDNNILIGKTYTWQVSAGTFRNNILIDRDAKVDIKSPNMQNNLAQNGQFGTDNGNRIYETADLFVGGTSSDGRYRIKANSPYIAAGYNGTQPGIFGGSEPYVLSGTPPIPILYDLNVPGSGSAASGLTISVKIRGAN
ncbi:hypothetical protein [Spirosoma sordidisoli]|uniref:Right-handed parallel beta-helix repeat-containing protein n=1 Tax=Spirosoma sordidisoli TaxID=2502893 RepID=A0A4Q2ULF8_9BACT|nr:hypothetical protein [Spirosoma sordidisoli]RYC70056.1 hypothetical protein EQG79_09300 [Spirosoma sordidisoli]